MGALLAVVVLVLAQPIAKKGGEAVLSFKETRLSLSTELRSRECEGGSRDPLVEALLGPTAPEFGYYSCLVSAQRAKLQTSAPIGAKLTAPLIFRIPEATRPSEVKVGGFDDLRRACVDAFVPAFPSFEFEISDAPAVRVTARSTIDEGVALLVRGARGEWRCAASTRTDRAASTVIRAPLPGVYRVWVGATALMVWDGSVQPPPAPIAAAPSRPGTVELRLEVVSLDAGLP